MENQDSAIVENQDSATKVINGLEPIIPNAVAAINSFLTDDNPSRTSFQKAKVGVGVMNTTVSLQRAVWSRQRHQTSVAKILADGNLDMFQDYVIKAMPDVPLVRKNELQGEALQKGP